jgi:ABC-2 type transport system permease protein
MRSTLAVARKEVRQIARDRRTLVILLFLPGLFLLIYGFALNFDIRNVRLAVQDRDGTRESRELVSAFVNSGYFSYVSRVNSPAEAERVIDRDEARAVLVVPEGFGTAVRSGGDATVQLLVNGDNANTATIVIGYANAIVRGMSARIPVAPGGPALLPIVAAEPRIWYNPELRSTLFLVPGLIAYIAMITAVVSTALSVVREKERGTVEQILMAPLTTPAYILGKTTPYLVISLASSVMIVLASQALFDLPMRGSWPLLLFAMSLFLAGALGTGLFISTIAESQQVAFQLALVVAFLPTLMFSDFIFPIANMPAPVQAITYAVPARYFLVALRGILLKGTGLAVLWVDLAALALYAGLVLTLSSVRVARQRL